MASNAEVARKAAELIVAAGKCEFMRHDPEGRMCFLGAIQDASAALGDTWLDHETDIHCAANEVLREQGWKLPAGVVSGYVGGRDVLGACLTLYYNNYGETSAEDIALLLKQAAERLTS